MRRPKSAGKREQIIAAGTNVAMRDGIWATTTRKIASEAEVNLATLHYHFESKNDVVLAIFQSIIGSVRTDVSAEFAPPATLANRIERAFRLTWRAAEERFEAQLLHLEMTLYGVRTDGAGWIARRQYEEFFALYRDMLLAASDLAGAGPVDIDGLSRFVVAALDGVLLQHFALPDLARSRDMIEQMIYLALRYPLAMPIAGGVPVTALSLPLPG